MDKLKLHTPDFTQENIARLAELFPNCVTEAQDEAGSIKSAIDFDVLRQELSDHVVDGPRERYHLNWPGKREALLVANAPIAKTLRPCREESVDFDTTKNLFIEGDNLDALKLLQETYLNKVRLIFIDPPYNTGREFIYDDDFSETTGDFLVRSNQIDDSGKRMTVNTDANGRFHSDWLTMMYSRLRLARNLLRDDGAIAIAIDDNEVANLRRMCDEVFGEENFIATVIWQKVFSPKNSAKHFSEDHDFIVVYARNAETWRPNLLPRTEAANARYDNPDNDLRGPWTSGDLTARNFYADGQYEVTSPSGTAFSPPRGRYWVVSHAKFQALDSDNRIWWGTSGGNMPRFKRFLSEVKDGVVPQTLWSHDEVGHTQEAKKELLKYVEFKDNENVLNSVKPTRLIQKILQIGTSPKEADVVLDFFSGSASTAHAVLKQNAEDGGNRQFIAVQIDEPLPKPEPDLASIFQMGTMRLRNVIREMRKKADGSLSIGGPAQSLGFRVLKVDTSNMKDVYYKPDALKKDDLFEHIENIKEDRTSDDLLFQVLLDWGVDLSLPIAQEEIDGKIVFFVDQNALAACFDTGVTEELVKKLAARKPLRAVFRDAGFGSDSVKINVEQIFKLLSPGTEVKAI
jgi:adenine-specific DNA-methyltransferase